MDSLIKAEFLKLSKAFGYKMILLVSLAIGALVGFFALDAARPMYGYDVYIEAILNSQVHSILFIIYAAVFVCNEFSNRTFGMSLFSGGSRMNILVSKLIVFIVGMLPILFIKAIAGSTIASAKNGFCSAIFADVLPELLKISALSILGCAVMCTFCVLLAVLIKNIGGTIGAGIVIMLTLDILSTVPSLESVLQFSFMYQLGQLSSQTSSITYIAVMTVTLAVTLTAAIFVFKSSELK